MRTDNNGQQKDGVSWSLTTSLSQGWRGKKQLLRKVFCISGYYPSPVAMNSRTIIALSVSVPASESSLHLVFHNLDIKKLNEMAAIWEHDTCYNYMIAGMKLKHIMGCGFNGFSALLGSLLWGETEGPWQSGMKMVTKVSTCRACRTHNFNGCC